MNSYRIEWKRSALNELKKAPNAVVKRIVVSVAKFAEDPFPIGVRKLVGSVQAK
jgi:hypothetical protein